MSRWAVIFSCLGHFYVHLLTAFYFVIVLSLTQEWQRPYPELIELWTLGALMVGAAALPAGLLSDRIGAAPMLIAFFIGMGACAVGAGFVSGPPQLLVGLTGLGLFAAIYHPVGIPWLVRNAGDKRGKVLAFNGIFGSLGTAAAGLTAGVLIDAFGWRAAFIVPGIVCAATGVLMAYMLWRGAIDRGTVSRDTVAADETIGAVRVFAILLVTMFLAGMIYQSTQTALPKVFETRHGGLLGAGATGVGVLVAVVYTAAGAMQVIGGHLADRWPLKVVYTGFLLLQIPLLWLAAQLSGLALVVVAALMVVANVGQLPAENLLLTRYTPARHHGLAFGLKFVLAFGVAPLAVQFVAWVYRVSGDSYWIFTALAGFAALAFFAAVLLPAQVRRSELAAAVAARGPLD